MNNLIEDNESIMLLKQLHTQILSLAGNGYSTDFINEFLNELSRNKQAHPLISLIKALENTFDIKLLAYNNPDDAKKIVKTIAKLNRYWSDTENNEFSREAINELKKFKPFNN